MDFGPPVEIVTLSSEQAQEACNLVLHVFDAVIAPTYQQVGKEHFHRFADPSAFAARLASNSSVALGAYHEAKLVAMIEVRDFSHICLLFTDLVWQGKGLGSLLVQKAIEQCTGSSFIEVNSAPAAVTFYQRMGFVKTSEESEADGIRFVPMRKLLSK